MTKQQSIGDLGRFWGFSFEKVREDLPLAGSPERSVNRYVLEEALGGLYILEELSPGSLYRKRKIAEALHYLRAAGLTPIQPCLKNRRGDFITETEGKYWQVMPYVQGVPLRRPSYVDDEWRGRLLADFLVRLRVVAGDIPFFNPLKPFSIAAYIHHFMMVLERHDPDMKQRVSPLFDFLKRSFMDIHDDLPRGFCHGDYHVMNVIWGASGIKAVIDWEFSGFKPNMYDVALLIGCVGIEDPEALTGGLVNAFLSGLSGSELMEPGNRSGSVLPEFVLAVRFAWLADWLRRGDRNMVSLELDYMSLLVENCELYRDAWCRRVS
ncbi:MAG: phosphotransferase [Deltaproteobacteria bacterium]|nr:phosphotransferase [Deltaproteobacteria bacterium]